jgi:hypothetical protein
MVKDFIIYLVFLNLLIANFRIITSYMRSIKKYICVNYELTKGADNSMLLFLYIRVDSLF